MFVSFVDSLYPLVITGDVIGARDLLGGLEGKELSEAKAWFAKATRWRRNIPEAAFDDVNDRDARYRRWSESHWIMALCAVELCGPATGAKRVGWDDLHERPGTTSHRLFVEAVCAKDPQWVAEFVEAASHQAGLPKGDLLRAINARVPVPCPSGPGYLPPWTTYYATDEVLAEEVAADPWMPEILFHVLDNGECAMWPNLASAVKVAVSHGLVDRERVVPQVLGLLTSPQRPASQRVLIGILAALDMRDEEVPGLEYVLGVIATSVGTVGKVLLPAAVRMVATPDDVLQLVSLVASRTEKAQKVVVLNALKTDFRARFGDPVVAEALPMLLDDDAAFSARVREVLAGLAAEGCSDEVASDESLTVGLWEVSPTPSEGVPLTWRKWDDGTWGQYLGRHEADDPRFRAFLVDRFLRALAAGDTGPLAELRLALLTWLSVGDLVLSRFTSLLPDLFLSGAMSAVWPVAVELADECCQRYERPGTTPALLRAMAQYAHEAPRGELPYSMVALAAAKGSTKIQMETRTLGAALAGMTATEYADALRASPPVEPVPVSRGLWQGDAIPVHRDDRLDPLSRDLDDLRRVAARRPTPGERHHAPRCPEVLRVDGRAVHLWHSELLLAETVRAVGEHGEAAVRRQLSGIKRFSTPRPIVAAIDLWALGRLTPALFWDVSSNAAPEVCLNVTLGGVTVSAAPDGSSQHVVRLYDCFERLAFLRASESLLLAAQNPVVLASPTYADGTLDIDDLMGRLAQVRGPVGLLDVMQALYRLRPCDASRAAAVPLGTYVTEPALTRPEGGSSFDAGALVREWVAAGGMPPVALTQPSPGWWKVDSQPPPITWDRAPATPWRVRTMDYRVEGLRGHLTLLPLWPEMFRATYIGGQEPLGCCGPYGLQLLEVWRAAAVSLSRSHASRYLAAVGQIDEAERVATELVPMVNAPGLGIQSFVFARLFESGSLQAAWHSALGIGVAETRLGSSGAADYLRMLTSYAHEVPEPVIPEDLREFANEPGADAAHVQGRLLVAALERS
jgi:hypothetical protein